MNNKPDKMVTVNGTFEDGKITLDKEFESAKPVKVCVTFLEEVTVKPGKRLMLSDFHFAESQKNLEDLKSSLADAIIEERRESV